DRRVSGVVHTPGGAYCIQRGNLVADRAAWSATTGELDAWLGKIREHQAHTFGELSKIRVGIKTTADEVFIPDDWKFLSSDTRPEKELLLPLLTHFNAQPWRLCGMSKLKRVLYPHTVADGKRSAIDLSDYPRAAQYLETHRSRLTRRRYVIDGGRK